MKKNQNKQGVKIEYDIAAKQRAEQKRIKAEAKAKQKLAQNWARLKQNTKYQMAVAEESCNLLTQELKEELFDGILLNLRAENKSYRCQKRTLRRIVEKRQAQTMHRIVGRSGDRYSSHMVSHCVGESMSQLHKHMWCA